MLKIDAQIHLWLRHSHERPWPDPSVNPPNGLLEQLPDPILANLDSVDVDAAVVVPPIWAGEDNGVQLKWCQLYPGRFGVMGRFDLWARSPSDLHTWLDTPGMLGIRLSFSRRRGRDWIDVDHFPWFWAECERVGIPIMLLIQGRELRSLAAIAERHPKLVLIVDHLGLIVPSATETDPFASMEDLVRLAAFPRVYGKLSSLPYYSTEGYPFTTMTEHLHRAYEAFGAQRLMWGSDLTRLSGCSYEQVYNHVWALPFLTDDDRRWIFGRTAASALKWHDRVDHPLGIRRD